MAKTTSLKSAFSIMIFVGAVIGFTTVGAQDLELSTILNVAKAKAKNARVSQARIDKVVEQTRDLKTEYNRVTKEIDGLLVYNTLLERQIADQISEMNDLNTSIEQVTVIERQVLPLMVRMIDGLETFVKLDVPFLEEERVTRISRLKVLVERSDVTVSEKFRRVLEAYQIENDFGRTIEAYTGTLEIGGASNKVDFLRIGRIALLYQTPDAVHSGFWDQKERKWVELPTTYRNRVRDGLRIAQKQIAPNLLMLPINAAESAQ